MGHTVSHQLIIDAPSFGLCEYFSFAVNGGSAVAPSPRVSRHESQIAVDEAQNAAKEVEEDEEEEEEEDEMWHLTDGQLKLKAFLLLVGSVGVVSFFSDPMVDVIGAFGKSINIDAFYISFVVTPIASNASEVIAGLIFAAKKTNEVCGGCRSCTFTCVFAACLLRVCCTSTRAPSCILALIFGVACRPFAFLSTCHLFLTRVHLPPFTLCLHPQGVSLCHSSLLGGASMNATMCLAVFMALIYFRGLTWSFSAEVITLFLVTIIVAFNNAVSQTIKLWQALMVALLYPFAIVFIWALKNKAGLD